MLEYTRIVCLLIELELTYTRFSFKPQLFFFFDFLHFWDTGGLLVLLVLFFLLQVEGRFFLLHRVLWVRVFFIIIRNYGLVTCILLPFLFSLSIPLSPSISLLCCICFLLISAKLKRDGVIMAIVFFCWFGFDILMVVF